MTAVLAGVSSASTLGYGDSYVGLLLKALAEGDSCVSGLLFDLARRLLPEDDPDWLPGGSGGGADGVSISATGNLVVGT